MKIVGVIPTRYASSRFPGKPLADICGKPMIWWVYQQAKKVNTINDIIVATDDERIHKTVEGFGGRAIMTSKNHKNGSERLSEVAEHIVADIYVTIQGDEPLLEPETIEAVIEIILKDDTVVCAALKTAFKNPIDVVNSTTPKVVCDNDGNALLFSRAPIPYPHAALNYVFYKSLGTYAFRREVLLKYKLLPTGEIEKAEDIELLRLIENGIKVRLAISESHSVAVDTPKDLVKVTNILRNSAYFISVPNLADTIVLGADGGGLPYNRCLLFDQIPAQVINKFIYILTLICAIVNKIRMFVNIHDNQWKSAACQPIIMRVQKNVPI
jgi:3-deoxy-manno-octulosonate cytidylyltransferase (CMP-KDO synthetase)